MNDPYLAWIAIAFLAVWLWQERGAKNAWLNRAEATAAELAAVKQHYRAEVERINEARDRFTDAYVRSTTGSTNPTGEALESMPFPMDAIAGHESALRRGQDELASLGIQGWHVRFFGED
ncbi:hypothetical protein [Luteibacter sp. dw_328]|uniref:hypothetical protein n=1 Tax=Luteibacter sp. dw_328 TaxID=2719796 RepID=UPI001BD32804|nr:hypothetical protein [Luteibacter sp. dw_328]